MNSGNSLYAIQMIINKSIYGIFNILLCIGDKTMASKDLVQELRGSITLNSSKYLYSSIPPIPAHVKVQVFLKIQHKSQHKWHNFR